jgi:hypothetical protein
MMAMPKEMPPAMPSFWMPYFQVPSLDDSTAKAKELGGKLMVGPHDVPDAGRFTIFRDPQGAAFAMFEFTRH